MLEGWPILRLVRDQTSFGASFVCRPSSGHLEDDKARQDPRLLPQSQGEPTFQAVIKVDSMSSNGLQPNSDGLQPISWTMCT